MGLLRKSCLVKVVVVVAVVVVVVVVVVFVGAVALGTTCWVSQSVPFFGIDMTLVADGRLEAGKFFNDVGRPHMGWQMLVSLLDLLQSFERILLGDGRGNGGRRSGNSLLLKIRLQL